MTGLDFFSAIYRQGIDLPVRIFLDGKHPNFYRPNSLTLPERFDLLNGFDVSIVADRMSDEIRELAKAIMPARPRHLVVCAGDTLASWAPARGWK